MGVLSRMRRELKNEPRSGQAEPLGLGRTWNSIVKEAGGLEEPFFLCFFSLLVIYRKMLINDLYLLTFINLVLMHKTILETEIKVSIFR